MLVVVMVIPCSTAVLIAQVPEAVFGPVSVNVWSVFNVNTRFCTVSGAGYSTYGVFVMLSITLNSKNFHGALVSVSVVVFTTTGGFGAVVPDLLHP